MTQFFGLYRAKVVNAVDPLGQRRLLVMVPEVSGNSDRWAAACVPAGSSAMPHAGATVWVQFEAGDPDRPVWVGVAQAAP